MRFFDFGLNFRVSLRISGKIEKSQILVKFERIAIFVFAIPFLFWNLLFWEKIIETPIGHGKNANDAKSLWTPLSNLKRNVRQSVTSIASNQGQKNSVSRIEHAENDAKNRRPIGHLPSEI